MSLYVVYSAYALNNLWQFLGRWPVKARLVMQHMSRDNLGGSVLPLMVVGACCRSALRKGCEMVCGMSVSRMLEDHLACLLARRSRPYAAELKVGRVRVNEYGHVRRSAGITFVVLVIGLSSSSGVTRYV
jgi:hypothetical protein